jgi:hypothetical protein
LSCCVQLARARVSAEMSNVKWNTSCSEDTFVLIRSSFIPAERPPSLISIQTHQSLLQQHSNRACRLDRKMNG